MRKTVPPVASQSVKKRLEKVTGTQYSLLRDLTDESTLDAATLEKALADIVKDRFELARGLLEAARILARNKNSRVRRSLEPTMRRTRRLSRTLASMLRMSNQFDEDKVLEVYRDQIRNKIEHEGPKANEIERIVLDSRHRHLFGLK